MIALLSPIVIIALAVLTIVLLLRKKLLFVGCCFGLCLLLNLFAHCFALPIFNTDNFAERKKPLRVLTYNVWADSPYLRKNEYNGAKELVNCICGYNADVVVLNELLSCSFPNTIDSLRLYFPYNSRVFVDDGYAAIQVFSKYPIREVKCRNNREQIDSKNNFVRTWLVSMIISIYDEEIQLMACHLAANNISNLSFG